MGHMKATTSRTKEEDSDDNTNIIRQPDNEGEKAKGRWVLSNFFLGFVLWWVLFFPFMFLSSP